MKQRRHQTSDMFVCDTPYALDFSDCLIYNKYHVDHSIKNMPNALGKTNHNQFATMVTEYLERQ